MAMNLLKYNQHWKKGFKYPYSKKRKLFNKLAAYIDKRQIVQISGLRRTGKTVLLLQVINYLLETNKNRFSILYFTFDEQQPKLDRLLGEFRKQAHTDFTKEKAYIFLDEIQKLKDFQNQIKIYYDLYPNIKFFISGSTSLFIQKKKQESLAGRVFSFKLLPLDFEEYLFFIEKRGLLEKPSIYKKEIEAEFEIYLKTQFIESINLKDPDLKKEYFNSILRKIIFEDIPAVFPIENAQTLFRIVRILASRPGLSVDYQKLSDGLGVSSRTVSLYLSYLEEAFLVSKLYNFSKNISISERKLKKYYLASPSFTTSLNNFVETGFLVENFIASVFDYRFFWRDAYKHEVDFIEVKGEKITPIEVKHKEVVKRKDIKNVVLFMRKFKVKNGRVLYKGMEERRIREKEKTIKLIPVFFLAQQNLTSGL